MFIAYGTIFVTGNQNLLDGFVITRAHVRGVSSGIILSNWTLDNIVASNFVTSRSARGTLAGVCRHRSAERIKFTIIWDLLEPTNLTGCWLQHRVYVQRVDEVFVVIHLARVTLCFLAYASICCTITFIICFCCVQIEPMIKFEVASRWHIGVIYYDWSMVAIIVEMLGKVIVAIRDTVIVETQ